MHALALRPQSSYAWCENVHVFPQVSYNTHLDKYILANILFIFLMFLEVALAYFLPHSHFDSFKDMTNDEHSHELSAAEVSFLQKLLDSNNTAHAAVAKEIVSRHQERLVKYGEYSIANSEVGNGNYGWTGANIDFVLGWTIAGIYIAFHLYVAGMIVYDYVYKWEHAREKYSKHIFPPQGPGEEEAKASNSKHD